MRLLCALVMMSLAAPPALAHGSKSHAKDAAFVEDSFTPPDVELVDSTGRPHLFMSDIARGKLVLISFFYANCKEICPVTNQIMSLAAHQLPKTEKPIRLISVTVDPERDTASVIDALADSMGRSEDWIWLTGTPENVRRLTHGLGMRYERPEDHGILFIVGDPDTGRFISTSGLPNVDDLVATLRRLED
jgi:protein SCO1